MQPSLTPSALARSPRKEEYYEHSRENAPLGNFSISSGSKRNRLLQLLHFQGWEISAKAEQKLSGL